MTNKFFLSAIIVLISIFTISCVELPDSKTDDQPTDNDLSRYDLSQQIDVGPFTFSAFADIAEVDVQGVDSLVKEYKNSEMVISLDYGWYSGYSPHETEETFTIDGFEAIYHTREADYPPGYKYYSVIYFEQVNTSDPEDRLSMSINSNREDASAIALALFKTIDFK